MKHVRKAQRLVQPNYREKPLALRFLLPPKYRSEVLVVTLDKISSKSFSFPKQDKDFQIMNFSLENKYMKYALENNTAKSQYTLYPYNFNVPLNFACFSEAQHYIVYCISMLCSSPLIAHYT